MKELFTEEGKKGQLLLASLKLFAEVGYDRVSVRDIAKEAGVSEAALYKHFPSKEEMALYIFKKIITEYTRQVSLISEKELDPIQKLCQIQKYTYEIYRRDSESIRFALLSQYQFWDRVEDSIKPHFLIRRLLEEGMEKGNIPKKPVYLWISLYSGLMLEPLVQYPFFYDEMPGWEEFTIEVARSIEKLLTQSTEILKWEDFSRSTESDELLKWDDLEKGKPEIFRTTTNFDEDVEGEK